MVAEFERYSPRRIVIEDAALGEERVSGTFEAGDVDALLRTLRMAKIARVEEGGDAVHIAPL